MADVSITAANVQQSALAVTKTVIAGEAITAGKAVYKKTSDNYYYLADCTAVATAVVAGIAINSAPGAGQPLTIVNSDPAFILGGTTAAGTIYVLSTTGGICPSADLTTADYVSIIGIGLGTSTIRMSILQDPLALVPA